MELIRKPTIQEERLIDFLVNRSSLRLAEDWKNNLFVYPMDDGEMGSLSLFPNGKIVRGRVFGKQVSDFHFADLDGVEVIASLNIDKNGDLFELDIWKTDFTKLIRFPDI